MNSFSTTQLSDAQPDLRNKERSLFFLKKKGNAFATFTIVFFGIVLLLFALYWGDFLEQRRVLWKNFFQTESDISTEHQNLQALELLSAQWEEIQQEYLFFREVLPNSLELESTIKTLDEVYDSVNQVAYLHPFQRVSWSLLPASKKPDGIYQDLSILEFQLSLEGEYYAVLSFFEQVKNLRRLMDLRSVKNFQLNEDGLVTTDVVFWIYSYSFDA